ncbi:MAG TPA: serine/threonine-protein kinase, partial [Thermoanaerobaculia bacterium]|nr:serine/threonine-protein kinase [Thermoanaerobaculia bacterium]
MTLAEGSQLGPYQILAPVGTGGMGEVYRARDTRLDRIVAIKVLPAHLSANEEVRQRFDREAKTISSLSHPHICALHDVGHQDGTDYLVMEFLEGESLADRLVRGPLPTEQVLRFGIQIADALDRAHRQGIVHRDLKPGNIMLTKSGVKLVDFGLAKLTAVQPVLSSLSILPTQAGQNLTQEGTILGTFQYMSPEQLEGREADARSDLFAFGAVLYEMATGHKAFSGKSQASLIAAILDSQPEPISTVQPMAPPALDRVVQTCLAKDPDDRWQTAHDVMLQLKWIAEGGSQAGVPAPVVARRKSRERLAWVVAAVFAVAAIALAAVEWVRPRT